MKLLIIAGILTLALAGCAGEIPEAPENTTPASPVSTPESLVTTPVTTSEPAPYNENNPNLKPLELLGYYIDEAGDVWVDSNDWEICEPDVFRRYMFGTWENLGRFSGLFENGKFILDDSEMSFQFNMQLSWKYHQRGDVIIFLSSDYQATLHVFWVDINEPNKMYYEFIDRIRNNHYYLFSLHEYSNASDYTIEGIRFLTKTDASVNKPENGYMSRLRLHEIMRNYNIDFEMIFQIEHEFYIDEHFYSFKMDGGFNTFPVYLILEESDKLMFKSSIVCWSSGGFTVDATYTISKNNNEWERVFELDEEQLKALHIELTGA